MANDQEKKQIEELEKKTFAQEIENDKGVVGKYFTSIENSKNHNDYESALQSFRQGNQLKAPLSNELKAGVQNKLSSDVFKRALILLGSGDMQITNGTNKKSASENNLPIASYLSHGARAMVEIPPNSSNDLINWLTSGDKQVDGRSYNQTQQGAIAEGKIVFKRRAATHDVEIKDGELKELKGFGIGLKDGIKSFFTNTNHFGVNLNLNPHGDAKDIPDGDHGHLYIHYKAPTANQPGSLLIGLEGSEPSSSKHSKTGASDPMSPVGSSLWDDLNVKKGIADEEEYKDTLIPQKYNGLFVSLDGDALNKITDLNYGSVDRLDAKFGSKLPAKTVDDFMVEGNSHKTPEMKKPKDITAPNKPKNFFWKKIPIIRNFFKKELSCYKEALKKYQIQNKVYEASKVNTVAPSNNTAAADKQQGQSLDQSLNQEVNQQAESLIKTATNRDQIDEKALKQSKEAQSTTDKNNGQSVS